MKLKVATKIGIGIGISLPAFALAVGPQPGFGAIGTTVSAFLGFLNGYLVPLVFALAFFMFLWGMFKYFFLSGASESGREDGKQLMLWGVLAFVMMVSIWGVVNVVAQGLGFVGDSAPIMPTIPIPGGGSVPAGSTAPPGPSGAVVGPSGYVY